MATAAKQPSANNEWKSKLTIDADSLEQHLAESPVYTSIHKAGVLLQQVHKLIAQVEERGNDDTIEDSVADEICQAISRMGRTPEIRFFEAGDIVRNKVTMEVTNARIPERYFDIPWTDSQYHAMVTYSLQMQLIIEASQRLTPSKDTSTMLDEAIRCMMACIEAKPECASMYVIFGNFLMVHQYFQDAVEQLEKAVKLDEQACFGAYYTMSNIQQNALPSIENYGNLNIVEQIQTRIVVDKCVYNLKRFLELAPVGHWHIHRACMSFILLNAAAKAKGSEKLTSIEHRHPGFCAEAYSTFERGVEAFKLYEKCYGREQSDFKSHYKQAAAMIATMRKEGLLADNAIKPDSEYLCGNPLCNEFHDPDKQLKKCQRCLSIRYCSKDCQTKHWKAGHKKECKKLKIELEKRRKANPQKMKRVDIEQTKIGERSSGGLS